MIDTFSPAGILELGFDPDPEVAVGCGISRDIRIIQR